ncbi:SIR2 family protein [Terasakiella pusilla]|uniref:SIR2 family protein n=1 Tax=Terasakiella pusilla TaxID=64973 RepID=UPI003AA864DD
MPKDYDSYVQDVTDDISACLEHFGCQPILFVGSGFSRRYFNGPSWEELLQHLAEQCPDIKDLAYYKQDTDDLSQIGSEFARLFKEWAWGEGKDMFPEELFDPSQPRDIYLKQKVCEHLEGITPDSIDDIKDAELQKEILALQSISPHAIITTNFDPFTQLAFPEYQAIIGQQILKTSVTCIGEIFKIHGCTSDVNSIVFTKEDYDDFSEKKKYLSAKLLTFFAEHPLIFIGYSASDKNIQSILSDIDKILSPNGELIPNIYLLEWQPDIKEQDYPLTERLIGLTGDKSIRIKSITASSFQWVFEAFSSPDANVNVNPRILRAILARTYQLVRHDIPSKRIEVNFEQLEHAAGSEEGFAKLYGITAIDNPAALNAGYPHILTAVGKRLGNDSWHKANSLLQRIRNELGYDIKASDNNYHVSVKVGAKSVSQKYSEALVALLRRFEAGEDITPDLDADGAIVRMT